MNEEVDKYLDKADHALIVAADLLNAGHHPDAASKIYYAECTKNPGNRRLRY